MHWTKKHSVSSQRWLERQAKDFFVKKAKGNGYRARSAFKLLEIDEKYHILSKAHSIIDLGAAPGGWSQVISQKIDQGACKATKVVGVDLLNFAPLSHVFQIIGDFTNFDVQRQIIKELDGKADLIISDIAPSTTGNRQVDHLKIMGLLDSVSVFLDSHLVQHGNFVAKIFQGSDAQRYTESLKQRFNKVTYFKPKSSRLESVEIYVIALDKN